MEKPWGEQHDLLSRSVHYTSVHVRALTRAENGETRNPPRSGSIQKKTASRRRTTSPPLIGPKVDGTGEYVARGSGSCRIGSRAMGSRNDRCARPGDARDEDRSSLRVGSEVEARRARWSEAPPPRGAPAHHASDRDAAPEGRAELRGRLRRAARRSVGHGAGNARLREARRHRERRCALRRCARARGEAGCERGARGRAAPRQEADQDGARPPPPGRRPAGGPPRHSRGRPRRGGGGGRGRGPPPNPPPPPRPPPPARQDSRCA